MNDLRGLWASRILTIAAALLIFAGSGPHRSVAEVRDTTGVSDLTNTEVKAVVARSNWNRDSYELAAELYVASAGERLSVGDGPRAAADLQAAARINNILGNYERAAQQINSSISSDSSGIANRIRGFSILSETALKSGNVPSAEKQVGKAVKLSNTFNDNGAKAWALAALAELEYWQFRLPECLEHARQALAFSKLAGDIDKQIEVLQLIGYAHAGLNEPFKGMGAVDEAVGLAVSRADARAEALSRFEAGFMFLLMNRPQEALDACRHAEQQFPDDLDQIDKARLLNGIASIYGVYGDWASALNYSRNALDLFRRVKYAKGELATLVTLIDLNFKVGDEQAAMDSFERARQLSVTLRDDFYLATAYSNLAGHFSLAADDENAEYFYNRALERFSKANYVRGITSVRNSIGELYLRAGQPEKARQYFDRALMLSRGMQEVLGETRAAYNLARLEYAEGNADKAIAILGTAIAVSDSLSARISNSQLRREYLSSLFDRYEFFETLLMRQSAHRSDPSAAIKALTVAERSRARIMLENISLLGAGFTRDANPDAVERENEIRVLLNAKADKLTNLLSQNADKSEIDKVSGEATTLENELEEIRADLKESSPNYSAIKDPPAFDVAAFQTDVLDENSVLLECSLGKDESYLWLVEKGGVTSFVLPAREEEVEGRIEELLGILKTREARGGETLEDYQARVAKADADYWRDAHELSKILLGPVADKLKGKRLIVVPDGKLLYFPISALPAPGAEADEPLLLSNEVVYEPSAQTLSLLAKFRGREAPASKDLLIFSDPVFALDDARLAGRDVAINDAGNVSDSPDRFRFVESLNNLRRLPGSGSEASAIMNNLGGSAIDSFSGFAATRDRLLATNLADYKIIHFATHALTDEARPELSGVVLSRFDEAGRSQNEFVRLNDIYGMNLKADLVVLSACETGAGKEVKGEGLISLNNAFLQVGARAVLATAWKAEDGASQILMKEFYNGIATDGLTPSKALQEAQIKLWNRPQYRSPFYWAAFTLQGDPFARPQVSRAFDRRAYLAGLIPLALLAIFLGWRKRRNYSTVKS